MARRKKTLPGLNRHIKTGIWHLDKVVRGHGRIFRSTQTTDYATAERRAIGWIKAIEDALDGKHQRTRITFNEAAALYITSEKKSHSIAT